MKHLRTVLYTVIIVALGTSFAFADISARSMYTLVGIIGILVVAAAIVVSVLLTKKANEKQKQWMKDHDIPFVTPAPPPEEEYVEEPIIIDDEPAEQAAPQAPAEPQVAAEAQATVEQVTEVPQATAEQVAAEAQNQ